MPKVLVDQNNLSDIADEVNIKNGTEQTYTVAELAKAVKNIKSIKVSSNLPTPEDGEVGDLWIVYSE